MRLRWALVGVRDNSLTSGAPNSDRGAAAAPAVRRAYPCSGQSGAYRHPLGGPSPSWWEETGRSPMWGQGAVVPVCRVVARRTTWPP